MNGARLGAVFAALSLAGALAAQDVSIADDDGGVQTCAVRMFVGAGAQLPGGLGFVRVDIEGRDDREHDLDFEFGVPRWANVDVGVHRRLRLAAKQRVRFFAPVPTSGQMLTYTLLVDGREHSDNVRSTRASGPVALYVSERSDDLPGALAVLGAASYAGKGTPSVTQCLPDDLPPDWRLLTAFHLVIVDGRAPLAGEAQEAVRRWVFAGGAAVLVAADNLPSGPLRRLVPAGVATVRHGLGVVASLDRLATGGEELRAAARALPVLEPSPWPGAMANVHAQSVPGLGQPPVSGFLSILILFAIVAGPVNLIWTRRRRRPLLVLATIPILGFGTTAAILTYGYVHDGLGLRGAETSWTLLDQERHECAAVSLRTIFAGMAPADLQLGPDTFVVSPRATTTGRRIVDAWRFELDTGRLDGSVLPSRTPTPLLVRQQGLARQRLRVRTTAIACELLADGGVECTGDVLLRDLDGVYWFGKAPRLARAPRGQVDIALAAFRSAAGAVRYEPMNEVDYEDPSAPPGVPMTNRLAVGDDLPPGSYLTRVAKAPWLDPHGLTVAWDDQRHFLLGRMQAEDFLR